MADIQPNDQKHGDRRNVKEPLPLASDRVPDATFITRQNTPTPEGTFAYEWVTPTTLGIFDCRKIVLLVVSGAFTPAYSNIQMPSFERLYDAFRAGGRNNMICLLVKDAFVMNQWAASRGIENVLPLPDGNGDFNRVMGMLEEIKSLFCMGAKHHSPFARPVHGVDSSGTVQQSVNVLCLRLQRGRKRSARVGKAQIQHCFSQLIRQRTRVDDGHRQARSEVGMRLMHRRRAKHNHICAVFFDGRNRQFLERDERFVFLSIQKSLIVGCRFERSDRSAGMCDAQFHQVLS